MGRVVSDNCLRLLMILDDLNILENDVFVLLEIDSIQNLSLMDFVSYIELSIRVLVSIYF